jgi:hypothetical protein
VLLGSGLSPLAGSMLTFNDRPTTQNQQLSSIANHPAVIWPRVGAISPARGFRDQINGSSSPRVLTS